MLCLQSRTEADWLARAIAHPREILIDHAHCERKAAAQALQHIGRFPDRGELTAPLVALAREELDHFEVVVALAHARGWSMQTQVASGYQARLHALVRPGMPDKLVDLLLVAALIEARSCERFSLLAAHHPDPELAAAFGALLKAEARHHGMFVRLARAVAPHAHIGDRLDELAVIESLPPLPRIHA